MPRNWLPGWTRPTRPGGNPGYPAWQMLRLHALRFLLSERYANRFLARVDNDPRLLELCGMDNAPSEVAFSRFKNAKQAPNQGELFGFLAAATVEGMRRSSGDAAGVRRHSGRRSSPGAIYWRWTPPTYRPMPAPAGSTATRR